jgi:hypothetical protein
MSSSRQLAVLWGAVAVACLALLPLASQLAPGLSVCPIKSHTGWPCPSCGTTRAMLALAELDPLTALALNPLIVLGFLGFVVCGVVAAIWALVDRPLPGLPTRLPIPVRAAAIAVFVLNWLYLVANGV